MRRGVVLALLVTAPAVAVSASASVHSASVIAADPKGFVCSKLDATRVICDPIAYRLSLEKPLGRPVKEIRRGETFRVVLWSPNLPGRRKVRYSLCVNRTKGEDCSARDILEGGYEYAHVWQVDPGEGRHGTLTISIKVEGRRVASKSLRLRE
jgi:hypothetical protein